MSGPESDLSGLSSTSAGPSTLASTTAGDLLSAVSELRDGAFSVTALQVRRRLIAGQEFVEHIHDAMVHDHEHWHVTHDWSETAGTFEHLAVRHNHDHDQPVDTEQHG
ncbi:hypothetical protein [Pseudonocardia asaccharolytica]|uniref:Uncharacterized protein n=1 Tax=Pseudonocardia asaccharolytica DSM 44247 = NBRC 16224 TaxID=1123024 RepID=A0A511D0W9_9PSEU|nr:hypothetical protein [Pseudonocardia asaccharolytica]GEL18183.1 hypothetical protein PA7_20200 [Pseudonocardia asaccharolytica DSM 44247 = NBRC 16224]